VQSEVYCVQIYNNRSEANDLNDASPSRRKNIALGRSANNSNKCELFCMYMRNDGIVGKVLWKTNNKVAVWILAWRRNVYVDSLVYPMKGSASDLF
jgi:hypothetical protein